ncbi:hypothetical protein D4R51_01125 [bacterium]|nr:MAG: hypothetical protein D4R51_01125 [bacterium]
MGLLDDYQKSNAEENSDATQNEPDTRRKRADLERNIAMADADLKKVLREIEDLEAQARRFKKQEERIRIERDDLDKQVKKLQDNKRLLEEEIGGLKKKLKILV